MTNNANELIQAAEEAKLRLEYIQAKTEEILAMPWPVIQRLENAIENAKGIKIGNDNLDIIKDAIETLIGGTDRDDAVEKGELALNIIATMRYPRTTGKERS